MAFEPSVSFFIRELTICAELELNNVTDVEAFPADILENQLSGSGRSLRYAAMSHTVNNNIVRLQLLFNGGTVESEWCWRTIGEPACTGRVYVRNNDKPDLPSLYMDWRRLSHSLTIATAT